MTINEQCAADTAAVRDTDVSTDDPLDVLSNARRRFVISCLNTHSKPMAVADVVDELTSRDATRRVPRSRKNMSGLPIWPSTTRTSQRWRM